MKLEELTEKLESADLLRILKGNKEIYVGYIGTLMQQIERNECEDYVKHKDDEVMRFRAVPEITHRKWKELKLKSPMQPDKTPDFSFSDLQMKLYYTIYI